MPRIKTFTYDIAVGQRLLVVIGDQISGISLVNPSEVVVNEVTSEYVKLNNAWFLQTNVKILEVLPNVLSQKG